VLKDVTGMELPPPARKTIDLEGRLVKDGVRTVLRDRQDALSELIEAIRKYRKLSEKTPLTLQGADFAQAVEDLNKAMDRAEGIDGAVMSPRLAPLDLGLQGNPNSRNWRMPLASFAVRRIFPEEYPLCGHFVIDTSLSKQDEILALLSDRDMRRIGVKLGVITEMNYPMPPNMHYEVSGFALNTVELPATPTFTSERGHKIWVQPLSENDF
jgi:hypothetical protein